MSIQVSCPNGHVLRVKDSCAGSSGYCPHCHAKVHVPKPHAFSEEDVIGVLGPPPPTVLGQPSMGNRAIRDTDEQYVHQPSVPERSPCADESGIALYGSSIHQHPKTCPTCHKIASFSFSICPSCGTPLPMASRQPPS